MRADKPLTTLASLLLLATHAAVAAAGSLEIIPKGIDCVVADRSPRIEALLTPADRVSLARVLFRTKDSEGWYWVRMDREADRFAAVLPKPGKGLKDFRYYVEANDTEFETSQTPQYVPQVVADPETCRGKNIAKTVASAKVIIHVPAGYKLPPVPSGFSVRGTLRAGEERLGVFPHMSLTTALLAAGAVGAGAAAVGLSVANPRSPPGVPGTLAPTNGGTITLSTVTPPVGSSVSLRSQPSVTLSLGVVARQAVPPGLVTLQLYGPKSPYYCATLTSPHSGFRADIQESVTVGAQITAASFVCATPFHVSQIFVTIDDVNHSILSLGNRFTVNYDFVP
jgi:hypothetical protein